MARRYEKISEDDRGRMSDDRIEQLAEMANELGLWAVKEREVLRRDIERLDNRNRNVVFDTKDQIVRYVKVN